MSAAKTRSPTETAVMEAMHHHILGLEVGLEGEMDRKTRTEIETRIDEAQTMLNVVLQAFNGNIRGVFA